MTFINQITDFEPKQESSKLSSTLKSMILGILTWGNRTRHIIALQSAFLMASLMGNIICWNAAIVKIMELESSPFYEDFLNGSEVDWADDSLSLTDSRIEYSHFEISLIFGMPFLGALLGIVPLTMLMHRYGSYEVLLVNTAVSCVATALTPLIAVRSFILMLVFRVLIGAAQCPMYPAIGSIVRNWAPLQERTVFVSILTGYPQLSAIITTTIASYMAKNFGWPSIFYAQTVFCGLCLIFWMLHFRDNLENHPFLSVKEFGRISHGKHTAGLHKPTVSVPLHKLLRTACVLAPCFSMLAFIIVQQFTIAFIVMYLVWIMDLDINEAGSVAIIPLVIQLCIQVTTGIVSDRITCCSEYWKIRIFNTLAFYCTAAGLIASTLFGGPENKVLSISILVASLCLLGFQCGGFTKSAVLISTQSPASVMACVQVSMTLGLFINPFIVPGMTPNRTFEEYVHLFYLYAGILVAANTFFLFFAGAETFEFVPSPLATVAPTPVERPLAIEASPTPVPISFTSTSAKLTVNIADLVEEEPKLVSILRRSSSPSRMTNVNFN